jgi:hypothetical protein
MIDGFLFNSMEDDRLYFDTRRAGALCRARLPPVAAICLFLRFANSSLFYLSDAVGVLT